TASSDPPPSPTITRTTNPATLTSPVAIKDCPPPYLGKAGGTEDGNTNGGDPGHRAHAQSGVRYADGAIKAVTNDIESGGFGNGWGPTRSFATQKVSIPATGDNGNNTVVAQWPRLVRDGNNDDKIMATNDGRDIRWFDKSGSTYTTR